MKRLLSGSLILLLLFAFCSCAHNYYVSNPTNIPLLSHKGDAKAGVEVAFGTRSLIYSDASGFNFSGAYAFSDKIGMMGSIALVGNNDEHDGGIDRYRLNNFELGLGYVNTRIGESFLFEVFAGGGYITQNHLYNHNVINRTLEARSVKYFLQPNIAYKKELVSLSFSPKFVLVDNRHISHDFDPDSNAYWSFYNIYLLEHNARTAYLEPTLDLTVGFRQVKLKLQGKYIEALEKLPPNHPKMMISFGLQFELDEMFSRSSEAEEQTANGFGQK